VIISARVNIFRLELLSDVIVLPEPL